MNETKKYTYEEVLKEVEKEQNQPIKTKWFKHKTENHYKKQISIFTELNEYEEINLKKQLPKKTRYKDLVVYNAGKTLLETVLFDDGTCIYTNKKYDLNNSNIMKCDEAILLINKEEKKRYCKNWTETTKEEFYNMFEILPPEKMDFNKEYKIFAMSENISGNYTRYYIKYNKKYYTAIRNKFENNINLIEELKKQVKK